jgi:hypothetical protein
MGPGGHFCRCKRRSANTNAYGYTATDANAKIWAIAEAAPHASAQALDFAVTLSGGGNKIVCSRHGQLMPQV